MAAQDLIVSMNINPMFSSGAITENVELFIQGIETADPNSPGFDEDDLGVSWGHHQFRDWRGVLATWEVVGSSENAWRLIAAIIKTCCVVRELCQDLEMQNKSKGQVTMYLSDAYLEQITEQLWEL
jgi:hypothetical protein